VYTLLTHGPLESSGRCGSTPLPLSRPQVCCRDGVISHNTTVVDGVQQSHCDCSRLPDDDGDDTAAPTTTSAASSTDNGDAGSVSSAVAGQVACAYVSCAIQMANCARVSGCVAEFTAALVSGIEPVHNGIDGTSSDTFLCFMASTCEGSSGNINDVVESISGSFTGTGTWSSIEPHNPADNCDG
jgi:hypothetical protein